MDTLKTIISLIKTYVLRFLFALVNRDFIKPIELTKKEALYSFLEENKKRLQYLMYQKNNSGFKDIKVIKRVEKYNEELKEALNLNGSYYDYRRPRWISNKMKRFLKNDGVYSNEAFTDNKEEIRELQKLTEKWKQNSHFMDK